MSEGRDNLIEFALELERLLAKHAVDGYLDAPSHLIAWWTTRYYHSLKNIFNETGHAREAISAFAEAVRRHKRPAGGSTVPPCFGEFAGSECAGCHCRQLCTDEMLSTTYCY